MHCRSSFSDFAQKHGRDERFKNVEKMRERESLFNEYLLEVRKREKEEKAAKREQVRIFSKFAWNDGLIFIKFSSYSELDLYYIILHAKTLNRRFIFNFKSIENKKRIVQFRFLFNPWHYYCLLCMQTLYKLNSVLLYIIKVIKNRVYKPLIHVKCLKISFYRLLFLFWQLKLFDFVMFIIRYFYVIWHSNEI